MAKKKTKKKKPTENQRPGWGRNVDGTPVKSPRLKLIIARHEIILKRKARENRKMVRDCGPDADTELWSRESD